MRKKISIIVLFVLSISMLSAQGRFSGRLKTKVPEITFGSTPLEGLIFYAVPTLDLFLWKLNIDDSGSDPVHSMGTAMSAANFFAPSVELPLGCPTGFFMGGPWLLSLWNSYPSSHRMTYNGEDVSLNYVRPWHLFNYKDGGWKSPSSASVGYELSWNSKRIPVGLFVGIDYELRQINLMDFDLPLCGRHIISSIVPSAGFRFHVLGTRFEYEHNWNIVLEGSVSDVHNIRYRNAFNLYGTDATESGIRYCLGLGATTFTGMLDFALFLRYSWDDFNFFNADYIAPDGTQPFAGFSNKWGRLTLGMQFGI